MQNARLLQNVAKQMQRVFKLIAAEKRGDLKESDRLVLTRTTRFVSGWLDVVSVTICYCCMLHMLLLVGEFFMLVKHETTALGSLVGLFGLSFLTGGNSWDFDIFDQEILTSPDQS